MGRWSWGLLALMVTHSVMAADRVVVVTATLGFRHDSIPTAEQVIAQIGARTGWFEPVFVHDPEDVSGDVLTSGKLVMFVNTTGDLPANARDQLVRWVRDGGAFIGVHSASDTWHGSPEYIEMLGGEFLTHPAETTVHLLVDANHPATAGLETPHAIFEEIYSFTNFSSDQVQMLLEVDDGRPIAWYRTYGAGRVLYTALGHRSDVWTSQWFQQHLTGAIAWALQRDVMTKRRAVRR